MDANQVKQAQVNDLLTKIGSDDPHVRSQAWQAAGEAGPAALQPLAKVAAQASLEVGRAAKHAMWKIVHTVGAPGAEGKQPACAQLRGLLGDDQPVAVRREVIWMLSEIAEGVEDVSALALLLKHPDLHEDARCALERIPGDAAVASLQAGFEAAPADRKYALADALRRRGQTVARYPSQKMIPTRATQVKPVGRA